MDKVLQKVYRLLLWRDRSEKEIRDFLQRKKVENIDEVIDQLKEQRYIDDEKFARQWVESRRRSKQKGSKAIKLELLQKGIERSIIDQVLSSELRVKNEEEVAKEALEKKSRIWRNLEEMEFRKKATDFLMRKGFEYETVQKVLRNFLKHE